MGLLDRIVGTPKDRFAREVLRTVRSTGVAEAWYDAKQFRIGFRRRRDAGGQGAGGQGAGGQGTGGQGTGGQGAGRQGANEGGNGWVYLDNVYRECERADRAERDYRIGQLVESIVAIPDGPETWDQVQPHLRPVLRPATFAGGSPPNAPLPVSRPAWEFLREFVVIDRPKSMAYVTAANLEGWGVDAEQVFRKARANLANIAALPASPPPTGPVLMRFVETGDAYFVSRLLVYGWLASLASRVGGRPVAFVPDQNTLIVTDDQADTLGGVFELVEEEYREAVRGVSPLAYTVDESGEVVPYTAPPGHPVAGRVHRAAAILAASEYGSQQGWLERDYEDVFVANLVVAQRPDGSVFTVASWTEGVDSLLPRADYIGFSGPDEDVFLVPWAAVAREVDLVPVDGIDPARFRLDAWPSPPVMDRLRAQAEKP